MFAWQATVQDEQGNAVPLPVVTVWESDGVTLASIFDEAGVALPNPLTGSMEGFVQFWATAGQYKIEGVNGGRNTEIWSVTIDAPAVRAQAWAESPVPPDPSDPMSKSAKTWAGEAGAARDDMLGIFADTEEALISADTNIIKTGLYSGSVWQWDANITPAQVATDPAGQYFLPPNPSANGAWVRNRKVFTAAQWPYTPVQDYTDIPEGNQLKLRWINSAGYQEKNTDGKYDGSYSPGKMPPGQTRLARTGSTQMVLHGTHSGFGDGYNLVLQMAGVAHPDVADVTRWSGQNSAGMMGGQINATTDKVNLYGIGDLVLDDKGKSDVPLLGLTMFLYHNGVDSGDYAIPRHGIMVSSRGAQSIDAAMIASGPVRYGIDLSGLLPVNDFHLLLPAGGKIAFAAVPDTAGDEDFVSDNPGTTWMGYIGSSLTAVVGNNPILAATSSNVRIQPGTNSQNALRILGSSATAELNFGQSANVSYITAASAGAGVDNTAMTFRTASAGVEQDVLTLNAQKAAIFNPPSAAQTLSVNGQVTFELTNNTTLTFRARGSDGNTRTGTVTLT